MTPDSTSPDLNNPDLEKLKNFCLTDATSNLISISAQQNCGEVGSNFMLLYSFE